jgi:hypothetical protein
MSAIAVLARPKLNGLGEHWGVGLPNGWVVHNTIERGHHVVTYEEFAQNRPVRIVRCVPSEQARETIQRVLQELSAVTRYDLVNNNCETFANRVTGAKAESEQVKAWLISAFVIGAVVLASGK